MMTIAKINLHCILKVRRTFSAKPFNRLIHFANKMNEFSLLYKISLLFMVR